uniref:Uncharacterized protein n=1 Tax=Ixodes ricinus TaxID=34613 RepID=A0A6B0U4C1_IXORI
MRLLALSSRVRSIHWVAWVARGSATRAMRWRAREQQRSERMGLRLYGMAEEPIWVRSKGSSTSFMWASSRKSVQILCTDAPRLARAERQSMSTLRV